MMDWTMIAAAIVPAPWAVPTIGVRSMPTPAIRVWKRIIGGSRIVAAIVLRIGAASAQGRQQEHHKQ